MTYNQNDVEHKYCGNCHVFLGRYLDGRGWLPTLPGEGFGTNDAKARAMWSLKQLQDRDIPMACINDKWVPARPENFKPNHCSWRRRLKYAWEVFRGRAETFVWPEGQ